jgi:hypothetical protein
LCLEEKLRANFLSPAKSLAGDFRFAEAVQKA